MATEAAATLVRSAAPGQFDLVAEQVQTIGAKTLSNNWLAELHAEHQSGTCQNVTENTSHPLAATLKDKLDNYQHKTFGKSKGVTARVVLVSGESPAQIVVQSYAEKIDDHNQYTGFWKATWTIETASSDKADICGDVQVHTCSYEDGNTQMKTHKVFDAVSVGKKSERDEAPTLAQGIVDQIVDWEHQVLGILAELHDLSSEHLRHIRRVLPITKTKMKWDLVAQQSVVHLKKTAKR
jgi:hypothetical protein